jgi:hypothetical membrane protein
MTVWAIQPGAVTKLARTALVGLGLFTVTVVSLHFLQPDLKPLDEAISYYVHGSHGWLLTVGLVGLGIASLAITLALVRTIEGPGARPGRWFLAVWGLGALLGGVFPADPPGQWDKPPTLAGMIHGNAALVAILALPVAALLLGRSFRRDARWRPTARFLSLLAWAAALSLIAFAASLIPVFVRPGPPILFGLTERILFTIYVAWLALVAVTILRCASTPHPSPNGLGAELGPARVHRV